MKYTILDLVQTIASSMDSDEVNSISDTVESMQIAKCVRTAYFNIINRANLPENYSIKNLEASGDITKPVIMYIPDDVAEIMWIKYDSYTATQPDMNMQLIKFLDLKDFLDRMDMMDPSANNVNSFTQTSGTDSYTVVHWTDRAPQYYTTTDDRTLIFDAYDSAVDSTLQGSKTRAYCKLIIPFLMEDTFIPEMDEPQFDLLLNEAKALAWTELKQSPNPKAEQYAKRGWSYLNKTKFDSQKLSDFDELPYYGRK